MKPSTPEARFVVLAAREPATVPIDCLRAAAGNVGDWDTVVRLASDQRLTAYVRDAWTRGGIVPPPMVAEAAREEIRARAAHTLLLNVELARAIQSFTVAQLPAIVLKGPALVRTLYDRAEQRPYGDIDLLVRERDEPAAVELLLAGGYVEAPYEAEEARQAQTRHVHDEGPYHRMFVSSRSGALIELHTDPLQLGLRPRCEEGRWQRAEPVPGLPAVKMFCAADQVVHLAVHAHKHGFERLIWLKDLDLLVRQQVETLDWQLVATVARAEGVSGSVWLALELAQRLLQTPLPDAALRPLRPALPVRLVIKRVWPAQAIAALEGRMRRRAVQFHAAESWRGMLPSLIVMGRRRDRLGAIVESVAGERWRSLGRPRTLPATPRAE
jgi:Uncharacterised nucleotidyltransferase